MGQLKCTKDARVFQNVTFRVLDATTGKCVQEVRGHNQATNTMLEGIGNYLAGNGVFNQGYAMLADYVPRYISLGTMGLSSQDEDAEGLPVDLDPVTYMQQLPGYGADGYGASLNNNRPYFGLGPAFADRPYQGRTVQCELVSDSFPRVEIAQRRVLPEAEAEVEQTVDIIFSAMISTGALAQFREAAESVTNEGNSKHLFITEAGLWSQRKSASLGDGLLAAYRIVPPNAANWDMGNPANVDILKHQILRVGVNQVVQVIWKIQLGSLSQLTTASGSPTSSTTSVRLSNNILSLDVSGSGSTSMLSAIVDTPTGTSPGVTWASNNTDVVVVDANGNLAATGLGTAKVTATVNNSSGASASCSIVVKGNTVSKPLGDLTDSDLCVDSVTQLGSSARISTSNGAFHFHNGIVWSASTAGSDTEGRINAGEVYIAGGTVHDDVNYAIYSGANNYVYAPIYAPSALEYEPETVHQQGVNDLPSDYTFPTYPTVMYSTAAASIPSISGATVIVDQSIIYVVTPEDIRHTGRIYNEDVAPGIHVTGYVQYIVNSLSTLYGQYGNLILSGAVSTPSVCYIKPGTYAFSGITMSGYCKIQFVSATENNKTILAVNSSLEVPENCEIQGVNRAVVVYTAGNAKISKVKNIYLYAPNGDVEFTDSTVEPAARVYCNGLHLHDGVQMISAY